MLRHIRTRAYLKAEDRLLYLNRFVRYQPANHRLALGILAAHRVVNSPGSRIVRSLLSHVPPLTIPLALTSTPLWFYARHAQRSAAASLGRINSQVLLADITALRAAVQAVRAVRACEPGCPPAAPAYAELERASQAASRHDDRLRVRFHRWF
jgi:hypothetical protein